MIQLLFVFNFYQNKRKNDDTEGLLSLLMYLVEAEFIWNEVYV